MARVTLSVPTGCDRVDQPLHLDRSVVDEFDVDHNPDECDLDEALCSALKAEGYLELARANWIYESPSELRCVVDRRVLWIAEVAA